MRRVLGIDPASVNCGYGIIESEGAELRYVECGVLHSNANQHKWVRICELANDLRSLLSDYKWGLDDAVGFESAYVPRGRHPHGVETLAEARGALVYVCVACGLSVVTVAPSTVKKAVTGHGRADKQAVAEMVRVRLGLRTTPANDAADALGVAIAVAQGAGQ